MKHVLIMEDNLQLALEWVAAFKLNQCEATLCTNVEDAISFLEAEEFDVLITELFVEGSEGGLHLLRQLKLTQNKNLPTIAVTGAAIPNPRLSDKNIFLESARMLGASIYIQKPFPAGELVSLAQDLWDKRTLSDDIL